MGQVLLLHHRNINLNKLSFASFLLAMLFPAIIILYESMITAIKISDPEITANILYQFKTFAHVKTLKGERLSFTLLELNIKLS